MRTFKFWLKDGSTRIITADTYAKAIKKGEFKPMEISRKKELIREKLSR